MVSLDDINIIHLSDLHFRCDAMPILYEAEVIQTLHQATAMVPKNQLYLCITGDIIYKGDFKAYELAVAFLEKLCSKLEIVQDHIVICPGNHDLITSQKTFDDYNKFVFTLTRNSSLMLSNQSISLYRINELCFLILNSAYHLDHSYGYVDIDCLRSLIDDHDESYKIICLHHHLIPADDYSCIKNAYEFLMTCIEKNVNLILHGHRHMNLSLEVGNSSLKIFGCGSLFFENRRSGYTNQFEILTIDNNKIVQNIYRYIVDKHCGDDIPKFHIERNRYGI